MCHRVELKVSQLSEDRQKFKMVCPRCGKEELIPISEIEEEVEDEVFDNNTELQ